MDPPRSREARRWDSLAILSAHGADAWVATASVDGEAYMVPLSIGWTGETIVLVTERRSPTAQNLMTTRRSRLGLGATRDVVLVEADVVSDHALRDAPAPLLEAFATQSGWDPRGEPDVDAYQLFDLRPRRLQAWRESHEIRGRTLLREGRWIEE